MEVVFGSMGYQVVTDHQIEVECGVAQGRILSVKLIDSALLRNGDGIFVRLPSCHYVTELVDVPALEKQLAEARTAAADAVRDAAEAQVDLHAVARGLVMRAFS